jgi:hypothetical protein
LNYDWFGLLTQPPVSVKMNVSFFLTSSAHPFIIRRQFQLLHTVAEELLDGRPSAVFPAGARLLENDGAFITGATGRE